MYCSICNVSCFIGHHVCYDPEISIPVCPECHHTIHYGELFYLDPVRFSRMRPWYRLESNRLLHEPTGEILEIPKNLVRYAYMAYNSRVFNRHQMEMKRAVNE